MNTKQNAWDKCKCFINSKEINETFTRKELIVYVYGEYKKNNGYGYCNIDYYRNMLRKLNYISSYGPGKYTKLKKIDINIKLRCKK